MSFNKDNVTNANMPVGTYWIGDLCYVMHDVWKEVCELVMSENYQGEFWPEGPFRLADGRRFAEFHTAYGDGGYLDQNRCSYSVDSGTIGAILEKDIDRKNLRNNVDHGHFYEFKTP